MVPIVGESTSEAGIAGLPSFYGQVEIDSWSWDFHNLEEMTRLANDPDRKAYKKRGNELSEAASKRTGAAFDRKLEDLQKSFDSVDLPRLSNEIAKEDERLRNLGRQVTDSDRSRRESLAGNMDEILRRQKKAVEAAADANPNVTVVLPTPPFWFRIATMCCTATS